MDNAALLSDVALAAARSRIYAALAAFLKYPDDRLVAVLRDEATRENLNDAASEIDGNQARTLTQKLRVALDRFGRKTRSELEEAYLRTFGASPRGRIAAYECEYGSSEIFQFANELSDISAFYSAFGLNLGDGHERPDHIAVECEFMRYLCAKEACLLADNHAVDSEHSAVTREAQQRFLREHIGRWSSAFSRQLAAADPEGLLGAAAELLEEFMSAECRRWRISVGPAYLPLREIPQADDPANCISCGKAEGLPGQISEADVAELASE